MCKKTSSLAVAGSSLDRSFAILRPVSCTHMLDPNNMNYSTCFLLLVGKDFMSQVTNNIRYAKCDLWLVGKQLMISQPYVMYVLWVNSFGIPVK